MTPGTGWRERSGRPCPSAREPQAEHEELEHSPGERYDGSSIVSVIVS